MKGKNSISIILAVFGVVLFSAKAVIVKLAYEYDDIDAISLLLLRMTFALPFYLIIALIKKPSHLDSIDKKDYLWLVLFGILGYYLASYFDFLGLEFIKASLERIILFIYPTLVLIISRLFHKKEITRNQIAAILISYLGIIITFWHEISMTGGNAVLGGVLIFFSALTYASYLVGSGWLIPKFGATTFTSYAMIISCIAVFVHYSLIEHVDILSFSNEVYGLSLAMALLSTVIPSYLVSAAINPHYSSGQEVVSKTCEVQGCSLG
jgi:drug/metabolite transporter (DMT)-like permease